ncbi:MAG: hypothetical protein ACQKBT_11870 [Puniceicoccales bacterium]
MMRFSQILLGLLLLSGGATVSAQVTQIDYSKRNTKLEGKQYETSSEVPQTTERWMSKRFSTQKFTTKQHRFADDQFEVEKMDLYQSKRFKTEELDFETREHVDFRDSGEMFTPDELDRLKFNTLHHDAQKESWVADVESAIEVEEMLDRLSLADLNRYQFRSSRPTEPGIPVQKAASVEVVE